MHDHVHKLIEDENHLIVNSENHSDHVFHRYNLHTVDGEIELQKQIIYLMKYMSHLHFFFFQEKLTSK
jgi:hypothetical protein